MRKLISYLLAAAVSAGCMFVPATVSAQGDTPVVVSVAFDKTELHTGDKVTATFSLDTNPGLIGAGFNVQYDSDVIYVASSDAYSDPEEKIFDVSMGLEDGTENRNNFGLTWFNVGNASSKTGALCSIEFTVRDNVDLSKDGTAETGFTVSFAVGGFTDGELEFVPESDITFNYKAPTVVCDHKDTKTVTTEPTCGKDGKVDTICNICGKTVKTEILPATGEHTWDNGTQTKASTCTDKGEMTYKCTVCGETKTEETDALGHDFGDWQTTKEPTCTETGVKERVCTRCNAKETEEIAALEHEFGDWQTTKEPTGTEAGTEERACTRCDAKETEEIAALGHTWGDWTVTKEATETETGVEERTCTVCGEKETRETPVLQPTPTEPQPTEPSNTTAPPANGSQDKIPDTGYPFAGLAVVLLAAAGTAAAITIKKRK